MIVRRIHPSSSPPARPRPSPGSRRWSDPLADPQGGLPGDLLVEIESIAGIGSYSLDLATGRWQSSPGLDAIFGIDARFGRTVAGWASLIHPDDRSAMVAYLSDEVVGRGQPFDRAYRIIRACDEAERWVHGRGRLDLDRDGHPVRMLGTIADVTDARLAEAALAESELRYRTIFDGTSEAILIAEVATRRLRWVNPAACALLGFDRATLTSMTVDMIHPPEALPRILEVFTARSDGLLHTTRSVPCIRADGTTLVVDIHGSAAVIDGVPCNIGFFTDVTEQRRLEDQDRKLARAVEATSDAILITGPTGRIEYVNPAFEQLTGTSAADLVSSHPSRLESPQSGTVFQQMWQVIADGGSWTGDIVHRRADGRDRLATAVVSPVRDDRGEVAGFVAIERDVTEQQALAHERERLAAAVEQTSDSVIITGADGLIEYVNPAFERSSGYRSDEVIGRSQAEFRGELHSNAFHRALRSRIGRGQTWHGTVISRRKDGGLYEEATTVSPLRGPGGEVSGHVAVRRDVTALRAAESALEREIRERAEVAVAISTLAGAGGPEETARELTEALLGLQGVRAALVVAFPTERRATALAVAGPPDLPLASGRPLPAARAQYLHERASQGPWAETWRPRAVDGPYGAAMATAGVLSAAYAPIQSDGELLGVVAVATTADATSAQVARQLPIVGEFAGAAGALLGGELRRIRQTDHTRKHVRRVLRSGEFSTIFEPIVDLVTGVPVGFEALTRFADGTKPDRLIAESHAVGLGVSVELACLRAALGASSQLPAEAWMSINLSPAALLGGRGLGSLLAGHERPIVIELTEHARVEDYDAIRRRLLAFGPRVSLAVDDAGAGFASLRHVVELRPRYLKLDASLVRHVDRDLARQAMIAGMQQYAARVGCEVLAEGIEDEAELTAIREAGVPLGQGFLLRATWMPAEPGPGSAIRDGPANRPQRRRKPSKVAITLPGRAAPPDSG